MPKVQNGGREATCDGCSCGSPETGKKEEDFTQAELRELSTWSRSNWCLGYDGKHTEKLHD